MGYNVVICAGPNHLGTRVSKWTMASEYSADFPDDNLKLARPSLVWRSSNQNPFLCTGYGLHNSANFPGSFADAIAIVAHTLRQGSGRWRARLFSTALPTDPPGLPRWIAPNGSSGGTNVTGSHTAVDDDLSTDADDGNMIVPTSSVLPWSILLTFPDPSPGPVVSPIDAPASARRQAFIVKCKYAGGTGVDIDPAGGSYPTLKAQLYEGGSLVRTLGSKPVTLAGSQYLIFEWDANELADPSGAGVQLKLTGNTGTGGLFVQAKVAGWWLEDTDFEDYGMSTGLLADSGWLDAVDDLTKNMAFGSFYPLRVLRPETSLHRFETVGVGGPGVADGLADKMRYLQLLLMDDQTPTVEAGLEVGRTPLAVDKYLQLGVPWASQGLELSVNRELGELVRVDDRSIRSETMGGNLGG
ncbi:MAG: hypothetical protein ABI639_15870, partial [Thermoanaerobaculia bacterium]